MAYPTFTEDAKREWEDLKRSAPGYVINTNPTGNFADASLDDQVWCYIRAHPEFFAYLYEVKAAPNWMKTDTGYYVAVRNDLPWRVSKVSSNATEAG